MAAVHRWDDVTVAAGRSEIHAAFVGTYPPTRCGIATFTHALAHAWIQRAHGPADLIRVMDDDDVPDRDPLVTHCWTFVPTAGGGPDDVLPGYDQQPIEPATLAEATISALSTANLARRSRGAGALTARSR